MDFRMTSTTNISLKDLEGLQRYCQSLCHRKTYSGHGPSGMNLTASSLKLLSLPWLSQQSPVACQRSLVSSNWGSQYTTYRTQPSKVALKMMKVKTVTDGSGGHMYFMTFYHCRSCLTEALADDPMTAFLKGWVLVSLP